MISKDITIKTIINFQFIFDQHIIGQSNGVCYYYNNHYVVFVLLLIDGGSIDLLVEALQFQELPTNGDCKYIFSCS